VYKKHDSEGQRILCCVSTSLFYGRKENIILLSLIFSGRFRGRSTLNGTLSCVNTTSDIRHHKKLMFLKGCHENGGIIVIVSL
jgi:hypothetical protein